MTSRLIFLIRLHVIYKSFSLSFTVIHFNRTVSGTPPGAQRAEGVKQERLLSNSMVNQNFRFHKIPTPKYSHSNVSRKYLKNKYI